MNSSNTSRVTETLDDSALTQHLTTLVRDERTHIVEFLLHLAAFDSRKLFLGLGFPSLFVYLRDGLRLSKASAYRRVTVARLLNGYPVIAEFLEDGRLNLTRVAKLNDVLTAENHLDVLHRASVGSEDDVDVLVATLNPKPDATDGIRRAPSRAVPQPANPSAAPVGPVVTQVSAVPVATGVPAAPAPTSSAAELNEASTNERPHVTGSPANGAPSRDSNSGHALDSEAMGSLFVGSAAEPHVAPRPTRMDVEPTSATAFCVRMRVGPEFLAEFEEVKAALSHKFPDGNFEDVFRECFRVTLDAIQRRRAAKTTRCGTAAREERNVAPVADASKNSTHASSGRPSRYVPASVRRAVWKRDGGKCAFVSADGRRCDSRHQLELHHLKSFATGGPSTEDNLSLRCRQHNAYEAELEFGTDLMKAKLSQRHRSTAGEAVPRRNSNQPAAKAPSPDTAPAKLH